MNKKMRELMAQIQKLTLEAKGFMDGEEKDVEKANELMDQVDALQKEVETERKIYEAEKMAGAQTATPAEPENPEAKDANGEGNKELSGVEMLAKQVRAIMAPGTYANDKSLVESVDADGGYTVPEDISTKINHWPEIETSFLTEISEENVSTNKGARTYQALADTDAFIDLDENGAITKEITAPTFERITYAIQDRAGFMAVSNDLIADSDANIMEVVTSWLGRANIATANAKILEIINKKSKVDFKDIDGIKKCVTVTLGQAYKAGAKIITNDDGLHYLDTLKDANGRPLLNPDPTDSAKLTLRCGTVVVPVAVKPNKALKTTGTKIPFIVGNLKEGIRRYNRQSMSLMASNVATIGAFNAFAMNMTLIRAILRDDYKELDTNAYVVGYIDTKATAS